LSPVGASEPVTPQWDERMDMDPFVLVSVVAVVGVLLVSLDLLCLRGRVILWNIMWLKWIALGTSVFKD